jgi:uncharacterized protein YbjT (DUF2867 family)
LRLLLIGASGLIGSAVAARLSADGMRSSPSSDRPTRPAGGSRRRASSRST